MTKKSFEYYFSKKELLKILSQKRATLAKEEHDKLFYKNLLEKKNYVEFTSLLYKIFPSRNNWIRLKKEERKRKNTIEINAKQIERTVLRNTKNFKNTPILEWEKNLYELLEEIQFKSSDKKYLIPSPKIIPKFKENKNGIKIYRPIAQFEYIDRVIIGQLNKYLTSCFDSFFSECSYAFRSKKTLNKSISHHKAVEDIIEFKKKFLDTDLWVAEYDINKFFDCVNHDVIRNEFYKKVTQASKNNIEIDKRAIDLFNSYLDCYSFNFNVKTINLGDNKKFEWVNEKDLKEVNSDPKTDKLGIPQGGALSCLMANILMDVVDKEVIKHNDNNLFYARFCDDVILIHPDKNVCQQALKSYLEGLNNVKLIGHKPIEITEYSKDFWNSKSKQPYLWSNNNLKTGVPWLSFVGYQISSNLKIRIRKKSIENEILKQIKETDKIIGLIKQNKCFRVSEKAIKHRHKQRLLAMSVGRKNIFNPKKAGKMCWTSGFKILKTNDFVKYQIKNLDRKRNAQIARLNNHLLRMPIQQRPNINLKNREIKKKQKYYGAPYSYYSQFKLNSK